MNEIDEDDRQIMLDTIIGNAMRILVKEIQSVYREKSRCPEVGRYCQVQ